MSNVADLDAKYERAMRMLRVEAIQRGLHPKELMIRAIFEVTGKSFPLFTDEPTPAGADITMTHKEIRA